MLSADWMNVPLLSVPGDGLIAWLFFGDSDYNPALDTSSQSGEAISTSWKRLAGLKYTNLPVDTRLKNPTEWTDYIWDQASH